MAEFLWFLLFVVAVWLLIDSIFGDDDEICRSDSEPQTPSDILDRRLAEGQITVAEYKKRKQAMRATDPVAN